MGDSPAITPISTMTPFGYMDYQLGWHSVSNHWLTNRLLYRLGPTVANTAPQPQRIGLLLPRATLDLFDGASYYPYMGWDWVLYAAKLPYTRVDEHVVREGKLGALGLEVLILPEVRAMDDRVAAALAAWVDGGGLLIASGIPGRIDPYGRRRGQSALADVLGVAPDGTVSQPVLGSPLTITIPHGHYSGRWDEKTSRRPDFEALRPTGPKTKVLANYQGGKPAIVLHPYGKGRAVTLGYPFGQEAVECERTSIGFQRTYVWFTREPQLIARTAWLRKFLGREKEQVVARCRELSGGTPPPPVAILTPAADLRAWLRELAEPRPRLRPSVLGAPPGAPGQSTGKQPPTKETVIVSYGQPANRPAAERLASQLKGRFGLEVTVTEQSCKVPDKPDTPVKDFDLPVILIGDEWTNNDLAMHGAYWGIAYGANQPFTATYAWPGAGRAVVSLSRRYALIREDGGHPFAWDRGVALRAVERRFPLVRRKLHIAANGPDADRAVDAILAAIGPP